ncbi:MAG: TonB-dependent receptor, partial [Bryobacteraceae bacterium]
GTANLGYHFSDRTSLRAIFREFDSYNGDPGQVYYGLTDFLAHDLVRDSALTVRLDDARGRRFTQHAAFTYHRDRDSFLDNTGEVDYNLAALIRTMPVRTVPATPAPWVYLVGLVPPSTTAAPAGTTLVQTTQSIFGDDGLTETNRDGADYQGTLTHSRGALTFGYQFERQAGIVSAANVARYDNGFFVHEQYALTPRIFVTAGVRLQQSNIFGTETAPRGSITFRLPTETFLRVSASRGIAEPSLFENFSRDTFFVGNPALRPEKTNSYEIGLYREWLHRRIRTDAAVFRNSFHDLIEFDSSVFPGSWINVDRSWARGAEFSGTVRLTKFAAVRAGYTRLYTRITEDNSGNIGLPLLRQPLNSGSVSVELTPRRWTLIAGARIVGERQDNDFVFGVNRNPGYEYVFVSGSWQATKNFAPFIRIENALDEQYQEALGFSSLSRAAFGGVRVNW